MSIKKNNVKVENQDNFLFMTFVCPFCKKQNVLNKNYSQIEVMCSNPGCRKIIILELQEYNLELPIDEFDAA